MWLADAHLLVWATYGAARLSARAAKIMRSRDEAVFFSLASLWKVAIKTSLGRPDFVVDLNQLHEALRDEGFSELPITPQHIARVARLPRLHRDPFDRMLLAQALEQGLTLLTTDKALKAYGRVVLAV
jgi:PIN domain nuclease of toxin-antitoxin system